MNWIDTQRQERAEVIDAAIANARAQQWCDFGTDFTHYVPDDQPDAEEFRMWLLLVNRHTIKVTGLGVFDHEDHTWRDEFDAGTSPKVAVRTWLEDSGLLAMGG